MLKELKYKYLFLILPILFLVVFSVLYFKIFNNKELIKNNTPIEKDLIKNDKSIKILFLGDLMFDRYIRQTMDRRGEDFVFEKVKKIFEGNDLIVGNLEGPITENKSLSVDSKIGERNNYFFTFDPKVANLLARENIKLVSLGNNHISNFGQEGIESTKKYLKEARVEYFGDSKSENERISTQKIGNFNIVFVNYNQFSAGEKQKVLEDIARAKNSKADLIILYTHWGTEFKTLPDDNIKNLAHNFIDAGADLVIGSHPHVVQTKEEYKGKTIYYSLGNFIFDQYFEPNTKRGLAVQIEINAKKEILFKEFSVKMEGSGQTLLE
jgi:poly-gamma-glutamate synthesis protein (capsule biosynthesis protein)